MAKIWELVKIPRINGISHVGAAPRYLYPDPQFNPGQHTTGQRSPGFIQQTPLTMGCGVCFIPQPSPSTDFSADFKQNAAPEGSLRPRHQAFLIRSLLDQAGPLTQWGQRDDLVWSWNWHTVDFIGCKPLVSRVVDLSG